MENIIAEKIADFSLPELSEDSTYLPIIMDTNGTTFSIVNNGTAAAPCRLTIVPKTDQKYININGLSDDQISISNVKSGQMLIVDGINRTVTIDNKNAFLQYDGWEFPRLKEGSNTIEISNINYLTVSIEYQPRYI